jgi:methylenetetrahydrofolate dehydrogenase (NAD+)
MSSLQPGKGLTLKTDVIAETFRAEVLQGLAQSPRILKLIGILATASEPCRSYAEFTRKECAAVGVEFVLKAVGSAQNHNLLDGDGVEEAIIVANQDTSVDGIMARAFTALRRVYH